MRRTGISNRCFFYITGFIPSWLMYAAVLAETLMAVSRFEASEIQMGLLGGISALGYTLSCMLTGLLSERIGRRRMCLIAVSGLLLSSLLTPLVPSIRWLYFMGFLRAVFTSFFWPPLMAWMSETSDQDSFSGILSGYNMSWTGGALFGFLTSGWTFEHLGKAIPFFCAAALAAGMVVFLLKFSPRQSHRNHHSSHLSHREIQSFVREGLLLNSLGYFLAALVIYLYPKVALSQMGETAQSLLHVIRMAAQLVVFAVMMHTTRWHFKRWMMWIFIGLAATAMILIAVPRDYTLIAVGFALLGLSGGVAYTLSAYYALALLRTKGLGSGIQETLIGAGNLTGPLLGGIVANAFSPRISILASIVPIVLVWTYLQTMRYIHPKS